METLFTPEVIDRILEILATATESGSYVLIVYFLLPAILLLISAIAWLIGIGWFIKAAREVILKWLSQEKTIVSRFDLNGKFITHDGTPDLFNEFIKKILSGKPYIHTHHIQKLMVAWDNQKIIDSVFNNASPKYNHKSITLDQVRMIAEADKDK